MWTERSRSAPSRSPALVHQPEEKLYWLNRCLPPLLPLLLLPPPPPPLLLLDHRLGYGPQHLKGGVTDRVYPPGHGRHFAYTETGVTTFLPTSATIWNLSFSRFCNFVYKHFNVVYVITSWICTDYPRCVFCNTLTLYRKKTSQIEFG